MTIELDANDLSLILCALAERSTMFYDRAAQHENQLFANGLRRKAAQCDERVERFRMLQPSG